MTKVDLAEGCLGRDVAVALASQICARASQQAVASCQLLELIGEFDAGGGLGYLSGVKSVAHWIAYSCSMAPGVAREHVRVARALRRMPTITAAFRTGELSYSKVREVTRVVDLVDEARLCTLARATSASQLARTIAGYRTAAGTRIAQQDRRRFRLIKHTGDGMTRVTGQLPADEAAIVAAALQRARDLNSTPPPSDGTGEATPTYAEVDAFRDICQHYLNTAVTDDESGEDRSLVIIQIAAEQLLDSEPGDVPAGTSPGVPTRADRSSSAGPADEQIEAEPAPAGTSSIGLPQADRPSRATPAADRIRAAHVPAGTSQVEPVRVGHSAAATPAGELIRVADVPAGTSQIEPAQAGHVFTTTPADKSIQTAHVPAGTSPGEPVRIDDPSDAPVVDEPIRAGHVPAGTSFRSGLCTIRGMGGIEPETARRHLCTGTVLGAVVDAHGDVLALGRTRRLVSKAQRRALMVRDQTCQFPGCVSGRHLQAHHVISWASGGRTDLANLILLCRFHHTCVHEGGVVITRNQGSSFQGAAVGDGPAWVFIRPDGERVDRPGWPMLSAVELSSRLARFGSVDHVDRLNHPEAMAIQPRQYGERFGLHEAVRVLFDLQLTSAEAA